MAAANVADVITSLTPEEQESVSEFLKSRGPSSTLPFLTAVDEFIDPHPELI